MKHESLKNTKMNPLNSFVVCKIGRVTFDPVLLCFVREGTCPWCLEEVLFKQQQVYTEPCIRAEDKEVMQVTITCLNCKKLVDISGPIGNKIAERKLS